MAQLSHLGCQPKLLLSVVMFLPKLLKSIGHHGTANFEQSIANPFLGKPTHLPPILSRDWLEGKFSRNPDISCKKSLVSCRFPRNTNPLTLSSPQNVSRCAHKNGTSSSSKISGIPPKKFFSIKGSIPPLRRFEKEMVSSPKSKTTSQPPGYEQKILDVVWCSDFWGPTSKILHLYLSIYPSIHLSIFLSLWLSLHVSRIPTLNWHSFCSCLTQPSLDTSWGRSELSTHLDVS